MTTTTNFHCPNCGYECDRDVAGAVNVGRKHLDRCKMETANPAEYISAGNHASFPSHSSECARSEASRESPTAEVSGVQSATGKQDMASGRQTRLSQHRSRSLTAKPEEGDMGGLHRNHGSNMGQRRPRRSVTQAVLASTTDCE
ncbi:transposase [Natrialba sp. SSL1]|uniref:transposase n=1 Tax=Natrialba sp. SSL1 TaxID=1869245 RepID=UPI00209B49E0|nr:transposase [Natrialba sp. SSL1]